MLPAYIRQEVERRLFDNGFRDYEGLAQWVRGQGYEISDDSLWRFGHKLQQELTAIRLTMRLARELGEDHEPSMARALITVAQQKALASLGEKEEIQPADLNAIANLTRAAIAVQRWAAELKAQGEQHHRAAGDGKCGPPAKTQSSPPNDLSPIAPLDKDNNATPAVLEEPAGRSDPARETSDHQERPAAAKHHLGETVVESASMSARDAAFRAGIRPALHRASPRIADICASEAMPFSNSSPYESSPSAGSTPTQMYEARRRKCTQMYGHEPLASGV